MDYVITILVILAIVGGIMKAIERRKIENGTKQTDMKFLIKKYKTTNAMEKDTNRLAKAGWIVHNQTAAPGFLTGTRSYTVTYKREE